MAVTFSNFKNSDVSGKGKAVFTNHALSINLHDSRVVIGVPTNNSRTHVTEIEKECGLELTEDRKRRRETHKDVAQFESMALDGKQQAHSVGLITNASNVHFLSAGSGFQARLKP